MSKLTEQEKQDLVRNLVNTYEDGDERHRMYKQMMKTIIECAMYEFAESPEEDVHGWIDKFVEERFRPR